jgi:putative ABC transport system ATP-binding protein
MTGNPVAALDRVSKTCPGGVTVLGEVDLSVDYGELLGIVGPSGIRASR